MTAPSSPSHASIQQTVRVLVQLIDPSINFTNTEIKKEFEKRSKGTFDHCLRYCPLATINNEEVAFLIHSIESNVKVEEMLISNEKAHLFAQYAKMLDQTIINIINPIDRHQNIVWLGSITLTDYIQNSEAFWGSFVGMLNLITSCFNNIFILNILLQCFIGFMKVTKNTPARRFHIKIQILNFLEKSYKSDYLTLEFKKRRIEEGFEKNVGETEVDVAEIGRQTRVNRRQLFYCERAEINGLSIAFLIYTPYDDKDKDRMKIYKSKANDI